MPPGEPHPKLALMISGAVTGPPPSARHELGPCMQELGPQDAVAVLFPRVRRTWWGASTFCAKAGFCTMSKDPQQAPLEPGETMGSSKVPLPFLAFLHDGRWGTDLWL